MDENGKIIESSGDGSSAFDGIHVTQGWQYSSTDLPDTITFVAKDVFEKKM